MEVNKGEAEKCLQIGAEALKRGDNARALKFLKKSLQLYPLPGVEALISQAERQPEAEGRRPSSSSSSKQRSNGSASTEAASTATGSDGREYTEEQTRIVKQVLRAKEGGRGSHYRVLGLEQNCSENDIKKAYRKLSLKVHPDKNSAPQSDEAFKAVGLAYATLSDTQKRAVYDRYGDEDPDNIGGGRGMGRRGGGGGVHMHGQEVSPEEIFNMFFGGGAAGMGGMGPGFHMYTNGFGGPGMNFQAGGPRRRPRGPGGQQPRNGREENGLQMLFQLLPVIMIFLISFLRWGDTGSSSYASGQYQYFSLKNEAPFVNQVHTKIAKVQGIPYYVSDKFLRTLYRDRYQLSQVERMVERAYEQYLVDECDAQTKYKKTLQRKAALEKDPLEQQKKSRIAHEFSLTWCSELDDLFPNRKNRKKKTGGRF